MKTLLLSLCLVPLCCFGQKDYCKNVTKIVDNAKGVTTFKSPDTKYIFVVKQVKEGPFFGLHIKITDGKTHFDITGATVEFEDGTTLKDEATKVDCKQEATVLSSSYTGASSSTATSGEYILECFFHFTEFTVDKFATKKIKRIQLDNVSQVITNKDATRIMNYVKCIGDMK